LGFGVGAYVDEILSLLRGGRRGRDGGRLRRFHAHQHTTPKTEDDEEEAMRRWRTAAGCAWWLMLRPAGNAAAAAVVFLPTSFRFLYPGPIPGTSRPTAQSKICVFGLTTGFHWDGPRASFFFGIFFLLFFDWTKW
jgi:hypothetical protein